MTRTLFYSCSHSDESHLAIDSVQLKQSATSHGMKAAEDSRTPKPCRQSDAQSSAIAFWSAAVLCRFKLIWQRLRDNLTRFGPWSFSGAWTLELGIL